MIPEMTTVDSSQLKTIWNGINAKYFIDLKTPLEKIPSPAAKELDILLMTFTAVLLQASHCWCEGDSLGFPSVPHLLVEH